MTAGLETFAKIRALHDRTTNPGEKAAAAGRMRTLARKVGLTVEQAVSKLDAEKARPPAATVAQASSNFFHDLFNSPEARAHRAKQENERAVRRAEVLAEYGSEEAVWQPCEMERALAEACRPFIVRKAIIGGEMDTLMGWSGGSNLPPEVRAVISSAVPLPATVATVFQEYQHWEKRYRDRASFCPDIDHPLVVLARHGILEDLLDTMPSQGPRDLRARLDWMQCVLDWGSSRPVEEDQACLDTLRADFERMAARIREQDGSPTPPVEVSAGSGGNLENSQSSGAGPVQSGCEDVRRETSDVDPTHNSRSPETGTGDVPVSAAVQSGQDQGASHPAYPSRRTNAEKRRAVLDLLGDGLSDREIARRAGVSPQTVGNIRRAP